MRASTFLLSLLAVIVCTYCEPIKSKGETDRTKYFRDHETKVKDEDLPKNGDRFEGDIIMDEDLRRVILGSGDKRSGLIAAEVGQKKHWPDGRVPFKFSKSLLRVVRKQIYKAIRELNELTCVRFVPKRPEDEDYVLFTDGRGCSSNVGRRGGRQKIHLGRYCKRIGTVLHEMMHCIGIIHEQSRSDRDRFIQVNFANIKKNNAYNFNKYSIYNLDNLGMPYNYWSVMHYSNYAFSRNKKPTLISKIYPRLRFGQRKQLSHLDVYQINKLYNCPVYHDHNGLIRLHNDMTPRIAMRMRDEDLDEDLNED